MTTTKTCAFEDCTATTERPAADGWTYLTDWPGVKDGLYCPAHAAALEAILIEGGLEDPENDLPS
jgi:hypothetical protein